MTSPRAPSTSPRKSRKSPPRAAITPASRRTVTRAHALIDAMLEEMQQGLSNPMHCTTEEWDRLFGPKQSMVANLQKLVAAIASLPEIASDALPDTATTNEPPLTPEEMELLKNWLSETS